MIQSVFSTFIVMPFSHIYSHVYIYTHSHGFLSHGSNTYVRNTQKNAFYSIKLLHIEHEIVINHALIATRLVHPTVQ